jgi:zinc protease
MSFKFRAARHFAWVLPIALVSAPPLPAAPAKPTVRTATKPAPKPVPKPGFKAAPKPAPAPPADPNTPWLYRGSDVPRDKEWIFGELLNGLRYAVRKNGVPPGQVSIRIRMDVGALFEQPGERGYAHLLEHLVFRQSKYLADGAAIPTWQRLGATFGSDTNALTSPNSTTFKLDLPNATPASLDESFKLLSGMMIAPTLSEANVRTDVPIVLAEKRERGGTATRVFDATQQTLFAGQKLAVRPVIGTDATLSAANEASVRAFHARWYRPENAVIVAVGDIDTRLLEGLVRKHFADWPVKGPHTPPPPFGDPLPPKGSKVPNPVGEVRVLVEPELPRGITYAVLRPWRPVRDTIVYNQGIMTASVAQAIINRRLEARARAGASFLVAQVSQEKVARSADMTFVAITPLDANWKKALADTRAVIADAMAKPPTQEEIDREVAEMNVAFESSVEQRRLLAGSRLADDMVTALDINETIASPETVLDIFNRSKPLFTPAAVLEKTRALFRGTVTRSVYLTPSATEATPAALRQALAAPVVADPKARLSAQAISFADLPTLGTPAAPQSANPIGLLDIEQLNYANGVKVLLWPTEDDPGRVTVRVRWGAGWRAFDAASAPYARLGEMALVGSGVGPLGQEEIDRISTGRKMGFDFEIDEGTFTFAADTREADLADQLYLFAAKFATPRWDEAPVQRAKAGLSLQYDSLATSPQGVLDRDLRQLERGGDPVVRTPTPQEIAATTSAGFQAVWQPLLQQGPIEVHLFGDFKRDAALAALERTFGALPARGGLPAGTAPARAQLPAAAADPVVLFHRGEANQAAAAIYWPTGGGAARIEESRQLQILSQLFQNRLLDALREKLGEAYAPQVGNSWPIDLENGGSVIALAQLQPRGVPVFFATADEIAADLIARPASSDELARVTEPLRQQLNRASTSSAFFMYQLEGASADPQRIGAVRTLLTDYTVTTPEAMQALARKYLQRSSSWRLAVIPQGQKLVTTLPAAAAGPTASSR